MNKILTTVTVMVVMKRIALELEPIISLTKEISIWASQAVSL